MPRRDKTGPDGEGPATGRGLGDCEEEERDHGSPVLNYLRRNRNRGRGLGLGMLGRYHNPRARRGQNR